MKRDEIMATIRSLARSRGFYGRLLNTIEDLSADRYEKVMEELERQNFSDPVDVVLYFES